MQLLVLNVAVSKSYSSTRKKFFQYQSGLRINHSTDLFLSYWNILKHRKVLTLTLYWFGFNLNVKLLKHKRILLKLTPTTFYTNPESWLESHLADWYFTRGNFTERTESEVSKFTNLIRIKIESFIIFGICNWYETICRYWLFVSAT